MKTLRLVLPWPPSVNTYYRAVPRGKIAVNILSKQGREYKAKACAIINDRTFETMLGRLKVRYSFHAPDRRLRDIGNHIKAVDDVMQLAGVFKDDYQIDDQHLTRGGLFPGGAVVVDVLEYSPATELDWDSLPECEA